MQIEYESLLDSLLAALPQVGIYIKDRDNNIIWRSTKLQQLFGAEGNIVDFFDNEVIKDAKLVDNMVLAGESSHMMSKYQLKLPNGEKHPIIVQKTPYIHKKEIKGIIVIFFDLGSNCFTKLNREDKEIIWTSLNNTVNDVIQGITKRIGDHGG